MDEKMPKKARKRAKEMLWLGENEAYLEENYAGMWLAVEGSSLVGVGATLEEAAQEARMKGFDAPLFHAVRRKEYQGIYLIRRCRI